MFRCQIYLLISDLSGDLSLAGRWYRRPEAGTGAESAAESATGMRAEAGRLCVLDAGAHDQIDEFWSKGALARDSHLKATGGANVGNQNVRERLDGVERKLDALSASVDRRFDAVDRRFDAVDQRFDRLEVQRKVQVEEFGDLVQRAAEGYGATLEHISRQLVEIHDAVTTRFGDHDAALENHATRIDALERR
ncbi:MAG: hypothetical protein Q8L86_18275 [Vicinamibacterales bacterium]|nr:hypothetical protein [Vicinamibacterales bacterium]